MEFARTARDATFPGIFARSPECEAGNEWTTARVAELHRTHSLARYTFVLLLVVIGTFTFWNTWDDASASTSVLHHHIFLMGAALVWTIIAVTQALAPWWGQARTWLIAAHLLIMGSYIGLAIATTNWAALTLRGWLQFWWAYPLMAGQIQQVLKLSRVEASPPRRSLRPVKAHSDALPETGGLHP